MRGSDAGTETPLLPKAGEVSKSSPATTGNLRGYSGSATESDSHEQSGGFLKRCADMQAQNYNPPDPLRKIRTILEKEEGHKRCGAKNTGAELRSTDTSLVETRERGTRSTSRKTSPTGNLGGAVNAAHKRGHVVLHQAEPAAAHTAGFQEDQPYRDPPKTPTPCQMSKARLTKIHDCHAQARVCPTTISRVVTTTADQFAVDLGPVRANLPSATNTVSSPTSQLKTKASLAGRVQAEMHRTTPRARTHRTAFGRTPPRPTIPHLATAHLADRLVGARTTFPWYRICAAERPQELGHTLMSGSGTS